MITYYRNCKLLKKCLFNKHLEMHNNFYLYLKLEWHQATLLLPGSRDIILVAHLARATCNQIKTFWTASCAPLPLVYAIFSYLLGLRDETGLRDIRRKEYPPKKICTAIVRKRAPPDALFFTIKYIFLCLFIF